MPTKQKQDLHADANEETSMDDILRDWDNDEDFDAAYTAASQTPAHTHAGVEVADDEPDHPTTTTEEADDRSDVDDDGHEIICGYRIHRAATIFPLLTGERFDELVESIRASGQTAPIIQAKDGSIMDGRNRLRAIERLRAEGRDIEPWIEIWDPKDGQTEMEFILAANLHRRHLTDDQRAMIVTELVPLFEAEAKERQKASRMRKGETRNPTGRNQHQAEGEAATESSPPSKSEKRTSADREANSTRGKVAAIAGVSSDKAGKAIAIEKSGDKELIKKVKAGEVKLAKAKKEVKPSREKAVEPYDLEKDVTSKWSRWMGNWADEDRQNVRKIVMRLVKEEEKKVPKT